MRRRTLIAIGLASMLRAQTASPPEFEVASIRKYAVTEPRSRGFSDGPPPPALPPVLNPTPGGLTIDNATLRFCLVWAYDLKSYQVSGPPWINQERYSIRAKTEGSVEIGQLKRMLQTLLAARFRLTLRRETKEHTVLGIVAARGGTKLAPSKPGTAANRRFTDLPDGSLRIEAKNTGLEFLERVLWLSAWDPLVNLTGLDGGFDFTFDMPPFRGQPDDIKANLNEALQRQLGLKLEPRKAPLLLLVVERGDPNPIAN